MKKHLIIIFAFTFYSCVVPVSIGNKSVVDNENKSANDSNTAITSKNKNH